MVLSYEDKSFDDKHMGLDSIQRQSAHKLLDEFPNKNWNRGNVDYLFKKLGETGPTVQREGRQRQAALIVHRGEYQRSRRACRKPGGQTKKRIGQRDKSHEKLEHCKVQLFE
jgi:hypothetical protein